MIIEQVQVGNFAVFAYVVGCQETGEGIVIDPADQVGLLLDVTKNRQISKIKYIVNTHCHADHAGGNREMKELTNAQIVVHKDDAERLANPSNLALQIFQCEASPPAEVCAFTRMVTCLPATPCSSVESGVPTFLVGPCRSSSSQFRESS